MARETAARAPVATTYPHTGARDELVQLLNARGDNDVLAYYLLPLVKGLLPWGSCATALEAVIGAARYTLDNVWGEAYEMYWDPPLDDSE